MNLISAGSILLDSKKKRKINGAANIAAPCLFKKQRIAILQVQQELFHQYVGARCIAAPMYLMEL
jgi:hypothetical protein